YLDDWVYKPDYAYESLTGHFKTNSLKGFGIEDLQNGIIASGAILYYLSETQHSRVSHISSINRIIEDAYVWMDRFTIRNLELYSSPNYNAVTLLDVIDKTISPMGGRLLRRWLALPLKNKQQIEDRHEVVDYLKNNSEVLSQIRQQIKQISDLERLLSKTATGKVSPKELVSLQMSLDAIVPIKKLASQSTNASVQKIGNALDECEEVRAKIKTTLNQDAPVSINKGNAIAQGINPELDELRNIAFSGKEYLEALEKRESEKTGIPSLKVSFNNVFGYYIEVRNTHKDKVPAKWSHNTTSMNEERYITEEIKEHEVKILVAQEKKPLMETRIVIELIVVFTNYISSTQTNGDMIANL